MVDILLQPVVGVSEAAAVGIVAQVRGDEGVPRQRVRRQVSSKLGNGSRALRRNKASGAPQLGPRSMNSQIGSPTIGRNSAVQKPQIAAQSRTARMGRNSTTAATVRSAKATRKSSFAAVAASAPVSRAIQSAHGFFPKSAVMLWPKNSPATASRNTKQIHLPRVDGEISKGHPTL